MTRPDWIACILRTVGEKPTHSWCGRDVRSEFHFVLIDHAALNGQAEAWLVACTDCTEVVIAALGNGQDAALSDPPAEG